MRWHDNAFDVIGDGMRFALRAAWWVTVAALLSTLAYLTVMLCFRSAEWLTHEILSHPW